MFVNFGVREFRPFVITHFNTIITKLHDVFDESGREHVTGGSSSPRCAAVAQITLSSVKPCLLPSHVMQWVCPSIINTIYASNCFILLKLFSYFLFFILLLEFCKFLGPNRRVALKLIPMFVIPMFVTVLSA
jgi:hypothetical protein